MATVRKRNPLVPEDHPNAYYYVTVEDDGFGETMTDTDPGASLPGAPTPDTGTLPIPGVVDPDEVPPLDGGPTDTPDPLRPGGQTEFERLALILFPSMPQDFISAYAAQWVEYADLPNASEVALGALREDPQYAIWFPGNLRDDGSVHVAEADYWTQRELYEQAFRDVSLSPDMFSDDQYVSLLTGDVSTREFKDRVRTQANEVLSRSEEFRGYYSQLYGFAPTDTAILASAFTGDNDYLLRQSGIAAVGFEGERREFDIGLQMAASLYDANVTTQGQAAELFGQAASDVPLFGALAQRHFDPDDEFDLGNFLQAAVFDDQEELRRMQRLTGQERALFGRSTSFRNRGSSMVGLTQE